ncbi:MAG: hypothetical protein RSD40_02040 [Bacilli bacterium]
MSSSNIRPFVQGANILILEKNDKLYGMTFARGMLSDYNSALLLIGEQSETGKQLEIGDEISVSCLAAGQGDIASLFGEKHTSEINKFADMTMFTKFADRLVIKNAAKLTLMKIRDIKFINVGTKDKLVICDIIKFRKNKFGELIYEKEIE